MNRRFSSWGVNLAYQAPHTAHSASHTQTAHSASAHSASQYGSLSLRSRALPGCLHTAHSASAAGPCPAAIHTHSHSSKLSLTRSLAKQSTNPPFPQTGCSLCECGMRMLVLNNFFAHTQKYVNTEGACSVPSKLSRAHCSPKSTVPDFSSCFVRIGNGFLSQLTHPLHYCHHHVSCSSSLLSVSIIIPAYNNNTDAVYRRNSVNTMRGVNLAYQAPHTAHSASHTQAAHSASAHSASQYGSLSLRSRALPGCLLTAHSASAAGPCQLPYTHIHTALSCHSLGAWQSN